MKQSNHTAEQLEFTPRPNDEIQQAEELLADQVWYNRHLNRHADVQSGKIKVVKKEICPRTLGTPETIQRDIWKKAQHEARKLEKQLGKENLGPWTDFEWGMINGKLSAIRWVLGDEWDILDT